MPEPDIIATPSGGVGLVGFELVCVDDSDYQKRFDTMPNTTPLLVQHHPQLDAKFGSSSDKHFSDARIRYVRPRMWSS